MARGDDIVGLAREELVAGFVKGERWLANRDEQAVIRKELEASVRANVLTLNSLRNMARAFNARHAADCEAEIRGGWQALYFLGCSHMAYLGLRAVEFLYEHLTLMRYGGPSSWMTLLEKDLLTPQTRTQVSTSLDPPQPPSSETSADSNASAA